MTCVVLLLLLVDTAKTILSRIGSSSNQCVPENAEYLLLVCDLVEGGVDGDTGVRLTCGGEVIPLVFDRLLLLYVRSTMFFSAAKLIPRDDHS